MENQIKLDSLIMKEVIGKKLMNMPILLKQDYISQFRNIRIKNVTDVIIGLFNVNSKEIVYRN